MQGGFLSSQPSSSQIFLLLVPVCYDAFVEYDREYIVFDQAASINKTPIHNLEMERQCGDTDHQFKKISTVSSRNILEILKMHHSRLEPTTKRSESYWVDKKEGHLVPQRKQKIEHHGQAEAER